MERYPPTFYNKPRLTLPQPNQNIQEDSSKKVFWILGLILLAIIGALVYLLLIAPNQGADLENDIGEQQPPSQTSQSLISCENWGCFINASEECSKAKFTLTDSINFFGVNITGTTYYELKGIKNNHCVFYLKTEETHLNYTEGLKQQLLDGGATQEEIDQQEQQANEQQNSLSGRDGQCNIKPKDLTPLLTRWADGNFSGGASCELGGSCNYTGDWEVFNNCTGDYFNSNI